ncbi:MAG: arginase [Solirubrobacterales bacterium]
MKLRLLHLDGSLTAQPTLSSLAEAGLAQVVNLKPDGQRLRLWARRADMIGLARRLTEEGPPPGKGPEVTFIGSGDYHHLTAPLVARTPGPLSVVHFDNHPDWGTWPPAYHCGSWVNRVLDMPHVAKVVTIGPCADATTWPQFKGANLGALSSDRFELHPWRLAPSKVLGRVHGGPHRREGRTIRWNNLAGRDWSGFVDDLARRLPTEAVYVSIDKDVLHPDEAVTNWNQGEMRVAHIVEAIRALAARRRLVGLDVCGEYAPPRFDSLPKRLLARFDQPRPPVSPDLTVNDLANRRLLEAITEVAA